LIQADLGINLSHFDKCLVNYQQDDVRALRYGIRMSQVSRFSVLAQVVDVAGSTVLDVGCGVGDLYGYLKSEGKRPSAYHGIEINPRMVAAARAKHPDAVFELRDLVADPLPEQSVDYVMESGIFNLATPHWRETTYGTVAAMYRVCRIAVAVNFLSSYSGNSQPDSHYTDPAEMMRFVAEKLSWRFALRHDYRKNDFTVFIYR